MGTGDGTVVGTTLLHDSGPTASRWNLVLLSEGYKSSEMTQWHTDAQFFVSQLLAMPPFNEPAIQGRINIHRVDVTSTGSGADDPAACGGTGATPKTYFDATYCSGGLGRLLTANTSIVQGVLTAQVPAWHQGIVVVNSAKYGGSGGPIAVTSTTSNWVTVAAHELGHSAFGLADEYEYYAGCDETGHASYGGTEPTAPNVTLDAGRTTNKWRDLVQAATAMPTTRNADCAVCDQQASPVSAGTVGAFEGAGYYHCGLYRPAFNCMMRNLTPFCGVCQRTIRHTLRPFEWVPRVVEVRAPDINYVFDPSGTVVVNDIAPAIQLAGTTGSGFLQSRLFPRGVAGTVGAGKYPYEYRVSMTEVSGPLPASAVRTLSLDFGPIARLNFDGTGGSDVYVITQGGLGTVRPVSVTQKGDRLTMDFGTPGVPAGSGPGGGQTSFFIGLASDYPPRDTTAQITDGAGNTLTLTTRAPAFPTS
ncbi:M64 family metallopeptidase [Streptomyces sp. NPDC002467]|uniref:M64 family metallopeptidase n=1 Tax=Streptomyces sp. NPDC002467 TaxID=3364647 RepID=UPI003683F348